MRHTQHTSGYLLVLVLVFGGIFFTMVTAFVSYVVTQAQYTETKYDRERALAIAEAGLDYYKWFLAHYPDDITNGTGNPGPYVHTYADPEGSDVGEFSLDINSAEACGDVYAIDITSTGHTYNNPNIVRSISARYARPTVSEFAYIINSNVWAGADRTIIGPYHSNGGVRMDGTNLSTVTSGQESWSCTSSFGCSPTSVQSGVFGDGDNDGFWSYPSPPINFTGLTVDLAAMQAKAQGSGGVYIGPSGAYGYRIVFRSNNTIDVYRVNTTYNYWGYTTEAGWVQERHAINTTTFLANHAIPSSCSIIFVEDKVWLEGVINGKVTIAAADVDTAGVSPSMILNDNITYANQDAGLLAIAEQDMLIGVTVPNTMTLNGIFVAQNGRFGRNHYCATDTSPCASGSPSGDQGLPSNLDSYVTRSSLTVNGTIVSNGREGTKWTSGSTYISGFNTRNNSYDRDLVIDPPPLTPEVSDTYEFIEWRENN